MADNLAQMFSAAPLVGASMFGQREALAQQQEALKRQELAQTIQKMQQELGHKAQLNPLLVQHQRFQNQGLEAGLSGIQADSRKKAVDAETAERTKESGIATTISGDKLKVLENRMKQGQMLDGVLTKALSEIETIPGPARAARLAEIAAEAGFDPKSPQASRLIATAAQNPQALMQIKQRTAQRMAEMSEAYIREKMKEDAATQRNRDDNLTLASNAKLQADAKVQAAAKKQSAATDILSRVKEGRVSPANAAVQFEMLATLAESDDEKMKYNKLAETMNKLMLQQRPQPPRPDPKAFGIETVPEPQPVAGQGGGQPKPAVNADVEAKVKAAGWAYEPDKYEYGINPATGKFARRPKGN